jgi:hypothetical protein
MCLCNSSADDLLRLLFMPCSCKLLIAYDPAKAPAAIQDRAAAAAAAAANQADTSSSNGTSNNNGSSSSDTSSSSSSSGIEYTLPSTADYTFPALGYWLSRMVERQVWPGLGARFQELGEGVAAAAACYMFVVSGLSEQMCSCVWVQLCFLDALLTHVAKQLLVPVVQPSQS